jgi:hypothetical protein
MATRFAFVTEVEIVNGKPVSKVYDVKDVIIVSYMVATWNMPVHHVYDVEKLSYPHSDIYGRVKSMPSEQCWAEVLYGGRWADEEACKRVTDQLERATLVQPTGRVEPPPSQRVVGFYQYLGAPKHTSKPWIFWMHVTQGDKVIETNHYLLQQHAGVQPTRKDVQMVPPDLLRIIASAQTGSAEAAAIGGGCLFTQETLTARQKVLDACKLPPTANLDDYYVAIERSYFR